MPNQKPTEMLSEMIEKFDNKELLKQAIIFALEVDTWNYDDFSHDVWTYVDQYGIERGLNKSQYLLSMLKSL